MTDDIQHDKPTDETDEPQLEGEGEAPEEEASAEAAPAE